VWTGISDEPLREPALSKVVFSLPCGRWHHLSCSKRARIFL